MLIPGPVAGSDQFVSVVGADLSADRLWRAEPGELVEAVEPINGRVPTSRGSMKDLSAPVSCVRLARH